jgi:hypothetical protein
LGIPVHTKLLHQQKWTYEQHIDELFIRVPSNTNNKNLGSDSIQMFVKKKAKRKQRSREALNGGKHVTVLWSFE